MVGQPAGSSSTLSPAAKDALLAVFSRKGSYVQELLVEELVAAVDALSREALSEILRLVLGSAPVALAMSSLEAAGPLRPLLLPFTGPLELMARLAPAVALTPEDEEALSVVRGIFQLVQRLQPSAADAAQGSTYNNPAAGIVFSTTSSSSGRPTLASMFQPSVLDGRSAAAAAAEAVSGAASIADELRPLLPELLPGLQYTGQLFVRTFVQRVLQRAGVSLSLPGWAMTPEQQEEAIAMAALNFMPRSALAPFAAGGYSSSANQFGFSSSANQFGRQQQQQQGRAFVSGLSAFSGGADWGSSSRAWQPTSMGQLVTGLAAAPFLAVLMPLAMLNELQRRTQQQQQAGEAGDKQF
jgi:aarF domain-containing kinase